MASEAKTADAFRCPHTIVAPAVCPLCDPDTYARPLPNDPVQQTTGWQPLATAPRDGTRCLYYSPGNPKAGNENALKPHMRVDEFSPRWPKAAHQYPEAPYTHWMPLPDAPRV